MSFWKLFPNFERPKPIIAMIHVFIGDPEDQLLQAQEDAQALEPYVDALLVENYGWGYKANDSMFAWRETADNIAFIIEGVMEKTSLPVGVNLLPNDYPQSFRICDQTGAQFIQLDHVTGRFYGADSVDAEYYMALKEEHPKVVVLGGIHPKYYNLVQPIPSIGETAEIAELLADAIVITGDHTGGEVGWLDLQDVRESVPDHPVIIGSGLNTTNAQKQLAVADGAIVGSAFKRQGVRQGQPIVSDLAECLMNEVAKVRQCDLLNRS
jgi:membrane complex biogenesis BtpA family protein